MCKLSAIATLNTLLKVICLKKIYVKVSPISLRFSNTTKPSIIQSMCNIVEISTRILHRKLDSVAVWEVLAMSFDTKTL